MSMSIISLDVYEVEDLGGFGEHGSALRRGTSSIDVEHYLLDSDIIELVPTNLPAFSTRMRRGRGRFSMIAKSSDPLSSIKCTISDINVRNRTFVIG